MRSNHCRPQKKMFFFTFSRFICSHRRSKIESRMQFGSFLLCALCAVLILFFIFSGFGISKFMSLFNPTDSMCGSWKVMNKILGTIFCTIKWKCREIKEQEVHKVDFWISDDHHYCCLKWRMQSLHEIYYVLFNRMWTAWITGKRKTLCNRCMFNCTYNIIICKGICLYFIWRGRWLCVCFARI